MNANIDDDDAAAVGNGTMINFFFFFFWFSYFIYIVCGVIITTIGWLTVTLLTPPTDGATLRSFYEKIRPLGRGWKPVAAAATPGEENAGESLTAAFLAWFLGCVVVYSALFGTGYVLYGALVPGAACLALFTLASWWLLRVLPRVGVSD